jgi:hypothetical protein
VKKLAATAAIALGCVALGAPAASAAPGGMPAAHELTGKEFGAAVSGAAQSAPGAIAAHVSGAKAGGMPAAHELTGKEFGAAVSGAAQSAPGAIAAHVSGR